MSVVKSWNLGVPRLRRLGISSHHHLARVSREMMSMLLFLKQLSWDEMACLSGLRRMGKYLTCQGIPKSMQSRLWEVSHDMITELGFKSMGASRSQFFIDLITSVRESDDRKISFVPRDTQEHVESEASQWTIRWYIVFPIERLEFEADDSRCKQGCRQD